MNHEHSQDYTLNKMEDDVDCLLACTWKIIVEQFNIYPILVDFGNMQ